MPVCDEYSNIFYRILDIRIFSTEYWIFEYFLPNTEYSNIFYRILDIRIQILKFPPTNIFVQNCIQLQERKFVQEHAEKMHLDGKSEEWEPQHAAPLHSPPLPK